MKKIMLSLLGVLAITPCLTAAGTLQVGAPGSSYGIYQTGNGGEFTVTALTGSAANLGLYASGLTSNISRPGSFQSFCIEHNEFIYGYPAVYDYVVNSAAVNGGAGGPSPDPISKGTAYLYSRFATGTLAGFNFAAGRNISSDALQHAIWSLEQEEAVNLLNPFIMAVTANFGSLAAAMADSNGMYGVHALNLFARDTPQARGTYSQDILTKVPDGGFTFALLAMGAGTLILTSRRMNATGQRL